MKEKINKQYIKNLEINHNKKLRKELQDQVSEETLNSPEFAKHARARFLRKRLIDLGQQASDFELVWFKNPDTPNEKWLPTILKTVKVDKRAYRRMFEFNVKMKVQQIQKEIGKVIREYEYLFSSDIKETITDQDIENAREYPIKNILGEPEQNGFYRCISGDHEDKTPSMKLHKDNTVHCYGCGWGDTSIGVYMKVNNCNFIQAVKAMR